MKTVLWPSACGRVVFSMVLGVAAQIAAAAVEPPPLPPGSAQVRVMPGLNPSEVKRSIRAHHHSGHFKKDYTLDDSIPRPTPSANAAGRATK